MYIVDVAHNICCFKFEIEDIEISVSCERFNKDFYFSKCDIALFREMDGNWSEMTEKITGERFIGIASDEKFMEVIEMVKKFLKEEKENR